MNNGLIKWLIPVLLLLPLTVYAEGEIYKVVDEDGNVTFTDQKPNSGAEPVDLPPLSVIETDTPPPVAPAPSAEADEPGPPSIRDLKKQFRDFQITQPQNEETFWGTGNTVVVPWSSAEAIPPEMTVMLYVDGKGQKAPNAGGVSLTLDRGEHSVYAELRDERNRRIITTETVTFFVKQHSVNFNRPAVGARSIGSPGP